MHCISDRRRIGPMLRIIRISPVLKSGLVVDPYVPLTFDAYDNVLPQPYLWRIGNFLTSLFELTIERSTGIVRGATLVLSGSDTLTDLQTGYEAVPQKIGLPIIDRSVLTSDIWDEQHELSLMHKNNAIYVAFNSSWNPSSCIVNDRVAFFEQEGELCGVGFLKLTQEEITLLKKEHFTHGI
jgi:hypothetical protein